MKWNSKFRILNKVLPLNIEVKLSMFSVRFHEHTQFALPHLPKPSFNVSFYIHLQTLPVPGLWGGRPMLSALSAAAWGRELYRGAEERLLAVCYPACHCIENYWLLFISLENQTTENRWNPPPKFTFPAEHCDDLRGRVLYFQTHRGGSRSHLQLLCNWYGIPFIMTPIHKVSDGFQTHIHMTVASGHIWRKICCISHHHKWHYRRSHNWCSFRTQMNQFWDFGCPGHANGSAP
jgi:hypothetical protein